MIKVKDGFVVCSVGGKTVAVASGALSNDFNGIINLNGTGELLFGMLQNGTTEEEMLSALTAGYNVSEEIAQRDIKVFLTGLEKAGILEK